MCRFAFIYFSKKEAAIAALMTMKNKVKFGDHYLTITPRTPKGQAEQQINVPGGKKLITNKNSLSCFNLVIHSHKHYFLKLVVHNNVMMYCIGINYVHCWVFCYDKNISL